jgi:hypothetical protein
MAEFELNNSLDIDPEDYWLNCSERERDELARLVVQEGHVSDLLHEVVKGSRSSLFEPESYLEQEIVRLFNAIWDSKIFIEQKHIDEIFRDLREKRVL